MHKIIYLENKESIRNPQRTKGETLGNIADKDKR